MEMIDAHMHIGGIPGKEKIWGSFLEYMEVSKKIGISRYLCVPIGLPENFSEKTTPDNDLVLREFEKNKKIIPVYWFNVYDLPEKIDERYKAIKFHPDIGGINIDDPRVVDFINKVNLPVFIHTNESKEYSNLGKLASLAKKVSVLVVAVHSGSVTKTFFTLDKYDFSDNVYFETSGIQYAVILKKIYERFGAKRIVAGSDYPFGDFRVTLGMVDTLNATEEEKESMMRENILDILG